MALDLPLWSVVEAPATLYEKDPQRFHLLLPEVDVAMVNTMAERLPTRNLLSANLSPDEPTQALPSSRFLWLELSPYRVTLTMQTHRKFSYRHYWERGVFGLSRFWLQRYLCHTTSSFGKSAAPELSCVKIRYKNRNLPRVVTHHFTVTQTFS